MDSVGVEAKKIKCLSQYLDQEFEFILTFNESWFQFNELWANV